MLQLVLETVDLPLQFTKSERRRCVQSFLMLPKLPFQGRHASLESPQHFRLDHPRRGRMSSDDLKKEEIYWLLPIYCQLASNRPRPFNHLNHPSSNLNDKRVSLLRSIFNFNLKKKKEETKGLPRSKINALCAYLKIIYTRVCNV